MTQPEPRATDRPDTRAVDFTVLENAFVRLEPLVAAHFDGLRALHDDAGEKIFLNSPVGPSFDAYLEEALAAQKPDSHVAYVVRRKGGEGAPAYVGMSRLFDISREHRGLEIGYTWYHPDYWGGVVNPSCKLVLMTHVFETCGFERLQLKTDLRNVHSQAAMTKMGATREGTLRRHRVLPDGRWRDSVYFSVLADEWPAVKAGLEARLAKAVG